MYRTIKLGRKSMVFLGVRLWNDLDNSLREEESLIKFKTNIWKWLKSDGFHAQNYI